MTANHVFLFFSIFMALSIVVSLFIIGIVIQAQSKDKRDRIDALVRSQEQRDLDNDRQVRLIRRKERVARRAGRRGYRMS